MHYGRLTRSESLAWAYTRKRADPMNFKTPASNTTATDHAAKILDHEAALGRVGGDADILVSLIDIFFAEIGAMMEALKTAIRNADHVQLERSAHRIKGSVSIFGAAAATETSLKLETAGRSGDIENASAIFCVLEQQIKLMCPALEKFWQELQAKR